MSSAPTSSITRTSRLARRSDKYGHARGFSTMRSTRRMGRSLSLDVRLGAHAAEATHAVVIAAAVRVDRALLVDPGARRRARRARQAAVGRLAVSAAALDAGLAALIVRPAALERPEAARVAGVELLPGEVERRMARVGAGRRVQVDGGHPELLVGDLVAPR